MTVLIGALVGFLAGRLVWLALKPAWQRKPLLRQNYAGVTLPTAGGIVIFLSLSLVEAGRALAGAFGVGDEMTLSAGRAAVLVLVGGFCLLGLLDDLAGREDVRGLGGHLRALGKGELTSGAVKLVCGFSLSLITAAMVSDASGLMLIVSAAVIALAANLANLFDLRPGRMAKVSMTAFVVLVLAAAFGSALVPVAIAVGAGAALILDDLRERVMMGDTGANALGAVLGLGVVAEFGTTGVLGTFVVLLALNALSEFVSFSKIIDSVAPLRMLDMAGRRKSESVDVGREADPFDSDLSSSSNFGSRATVGGAPERISRETQSVDQVDLRDEFDSRLGSRPERGDQ